MGTVVVVQADPQIRELYADWLRCEGFDVVTCAGPEPPDFDCPVLKFCGCIECEQSDAMVYDPCLTSQRGHPCSDRIIYRLREWYPEKPVVVIDHGALPPRVVRLVAEDTGVRVVAEVTPAVLVTEVRSALGAAG